MAEEAGYTVDSARLLQQARRTLSASRNWQERFVTLETSINEPIGQSYRAVGVAAVGYAPSPITEGIVHVVSAQQHVSGRWGVSSRRPPHEDSDFTATALSIRTLQLYASSTQRADASRRIARARAWLQQATPEETEDQAMQLLGLAWAGQHEGLEQYIAALRNGQRADGGWGQISKRPSDAYATGQALVALQHAGGMSPTDPVLQRGYQFLVGSQQADGSWHVRTRRTSSDGLPYFESGFPHGRDQFISYAGSAWAVMAMSFAQSSRSSHALLGASRARLVVRADTLSDSGLTPLMRVALSGTVDELSSFLRAGRDVNARTESGLTALMCAAHDSAKVRVLLDAGADPNARMRSGHSALLIAAATDGAEPSVRLLLARGASVDEPATRSNHPGLAPMGRAIARGDTVVAALLLQHGARVDGPVRTETTPLLTGAPPRRVRSWPVARKWI